MENTKICGEVVSSGTGKKDGHACFNNKPCAIHDTNTLREEFVLYMTQNPKGSELLKFPDLSSPDKIADFFINKFNQKLEEIEESIEKEKLPFKVSENTELRDAFNNGLDLSLQIIKNKKN